MDALSSVVKPILQPITHALPEPVRQLGISILGSPCYETIVDNVNLADQVCLKLAISKGLGIGIVGAASIVKVPQILKLLKSRSAAGLSLSSTLMETASYAITIAYNFRNGFPFSTFGEMALITIQNLIICVLILRYKGQAAAGGALLAGAMGSAVALNNNSLVSPERMRWLQAMTIPLGLASKIPQIWTIWQQGSTGQLSAFAVFNFLAGSLARVFTTLQEVDDPLILYGFIGGALLNAVLAAQMIYYWNSAPKSAKKGGKKKKASNTPASSSLQTPTQSQGIQTRSRSKSPAVQTAADVTPSKSSVRGRKGKNT